MDIEAVRHVLFGGKNRKFGIFFGGSWDLWNAIVRDLGPGLSPVDESVAPPDLAHAGAGLHPYLFLHGPEIFTEDMDGTALLEWVKHLEQTSKPEGRILFLNGTGNTRMKEVVEARIPFKQGVMMRHPEMTTIFFPVKAGDVLCHLTIGTEPLPEPIAI